MTNAAISVTYEHKRFGSTEVLKGINYEIAGGAVTCLIEPSGSAKNTLLHCTALLDEGKLLLNSKPLDIFCKPRHPRRDQFLDSYRDRGAAMPA